jgi:hypothetical protein
MDRLPVAWFSLPEGSAPEASACPAVDFLPVRLETLAGDPGIREKANAGL